MGNILSLLAHATNGNCYKSYKYCADTDITIPTIKYEETKDLVPVKGKYGETDTSLKKPKDLFEFSRKISQSEPLFRFFLDGSRRTYKVDDLELNRRIFPIMAGQVGVACCERKGPDEFKCLELEKSLVIALPSEANPDLKNSDLFFNNLTDKINNVERVQNAGTKFTKILDYPSKRLETLEDIESRKYEHLGIAMIQDEMIDCEKRIVSKLTNRNVLNESSYLMKDGSLQYKPMKTGEYKELAKIKNNYRRVVGVSKLFNPELFKDKSNKSNAAAIAELPLFSRTPAFLFHHDLEKQSYLGDFKFAIWYVRIRHRERTESPFAGVVKVEKILITEKENEEGLESDLVDIITANIINERNPVCYGQDKRWANHLYPIYLTEQFLKSHYLSDTHFLNLF
ncbi:DNA double-strand break repair nuclease NurA [Flaviaesturariibacter amylovorans]|uniref:NurA domain-containing protein n=1 Tax=Flaviaesturariibacter amylovorans TaxID=1084520 RepID=A0ABP8HIP8_9BACT